VITECFRIDAKGKIIDTEYKLVSRESAFAKHDRNNDAPARPAAKGAPGFFWDEGAAFNRGFEAVGPRGGCIPRYDSSGAQTGPC
jgi:hypothetical protein